MNTHVSHECVNYATERQTMRVSIIITAEHPDTGQSMLLLGETDFAIAYTKASNCVNAISGSVKPREDPWEAAKRECFEETMGQLELDGEPRMHLVVGKHHVFWYTIPYSMELIHNFREWRETLGGINHLIRDNELSDSEEEAVFSGDHSRILSHPAVVSEPLRTRRPTQHSRRQRYVRFIKHEFLEFARLRWWTFREIMLAYRNDWKYIHEHSVLRRFSEPTIEAILAVCSDWVEGFADVPEVDCA